MAQLVLGTVGAIVGSFVPGLGTALGWAIGSAIGALIDPPKGPTVEGPKLTDLKTQVADYGTVLPVIYGTVRMAGNVIWADQIRERKVKSGGGKGGGGQTTITYVYTLSFAVGLCEGVIEGVRRIWANGELIYAATESSTAGTLTESGKSKGGFRVYRGTADQMPDPTIEAVKGVGKTVPYRGTAYVCFTDLALEKFGNRMPNLEFEVVKAGETVGYRMLYDEWTQDIMPISEWEENTKSVTGFSQMPGHFGPRFISSNGPFIRLTSPIGLQSGLIGNDISWAPGKIYDLNVGQEPGTSVQVVEAIQNWEDRPGPHQSFAKEIDGVWHDMVSMCSFGRSVDGLSFVDMYIPRNRPSDLSLGYKLSTRDVLMWGGMYKRGLAGAADYYIHGKRDLALMFLSPPLSNRYFMGLHGSGDGTHIIIFSGTEPYSLDPNEPHVADKFHLVNLVGNHPTLVMTGDIDEPRDVINYLGGLGVQLGLTDPFSSVYANAAGMLDTDAETFWCRGGNNRSQGYLLRYQIIDGVFTKINEERLEAGPDGQVFASSDLSTVWAYDGVAVTFSHQFFENDKPWFHDYCSVTTRNPYITKQAVPLANICADQLNRVGFDPSEYDVTELTDLVDGFYLANRPSTRTAIETLTSPYFFDVVESGSRLKFVKRGKAPVRVITAQEMGGHDGAANERPETLTITRQHELSQPLEISAQYQDRDADYRIGVQYARRQQTEAVNETSVQLPLVLSGTKAKQVVDAVLFNQWMEREKVEFVTDRRHIDLEPTDLIQVQSLNGNVWTVRLTVRNEGANGTIKWEGVGQAGSVYDPLATGVFVPPTTGEQISGSVPTFQIVFNAPPLSDSVDTPGFYVAATGYSSGWAGSVAMRSMDSGVTYNILDNSVVDRSDNSSMGFATTILGNWEGGNILDTKNSVTVKIVGIGELASTTPLEVLNGANAIWMAGEVLQFEMAEQLTANTYKLSRLRRGRFGTERFIGEHQSNEQFVLLDLSETQFQPDALGNVGGVQLIRGLSLDNQDPSTVPAANFSFDGTTVRPLSPSHAFAIRSLDGSLDMKWVRRARINAQWLDGVDVPLDEPTELYELDVATDSNFTNVVRTISSTVPNAAYSAAERLLDTGSTAGDLWIRVYQMSSRIGRGFPATLVFV